MRTACCAMLRTAVLLMLDASARECEAPGHSSPGIEILGFFRLLLRPHLCGSCAYQAQVGLNSVAAAPILLCRGHTINLYLTTILPQVLFG